MNCRNAVVILYDSEGFRDLGRNPHEGRISRRLDRESKTDRRSKVDRVARAGSLEAITNFFGSDGFQAWPSDQLQC